MVQRLLLVTSVLMAAFPLAAQRQSGELRLRVVDSTRAPLPATGELVGQATQVRKPFTTGPDGLQTIPALPFGVTVWTVTPVSQTGFGQIQNFTSAAP